MKTYIVLTSKGFVATKSTSKKGAYTNVTNAGFKANKGSVTISSCDIAYVSCGKL